jgi:AcrR family transcriptional regulator
VQEQPGVRTAWKQQTPVERRREILDAALAIADEGGLAAVSMRAVAQRVGVTAMALYPHVSSKDDLLDSLVGRLLAELPLPDPAEPWRDRLAGIAAAARALAHRHPAAVPLLFSRPSVTPDAVAVVDALYQGLIDAGLPLAQVPRFERLVSTFVLGYGISEVAGRFAAGVVNPRVLRAQLEGAELPAHRALLPWLEQPLDHDAEFEADLADLFTLIESAVAAAGELSRERDS